MKRLLTIALAAMCIVAGRAEEDTVLYWLVDPDDTPEFNYATIRFGTESDGTHLTGENTMLANNYFVGFDDYDYYIGDSRPDVMEAKSAANLTEVVRNLTALGVSVTDFTQLSFIVELFNENDELMYYSNIYNVAELGNYIGKWRELSSGWTSVDWLIVTPFHEVPEPCSGVLLLIGGGLLALRRKERKS